MSTPIRSLERPCVMLKRRGVEILFLTCHVEPDELVIT